jgi:putative endonuclease
MDPKSELGKVGEAKALEFLVAENFEILETNWLFGHKELDIVARKGGLIHVVEVKTRASAYFEEPKEAVNRRKQKNMVEAADAFMVKHKLFEEVQFDIISIIIERSTGKVELEYIPQAFYPGF